MDKLHNCSHATKSDQYGGAIGACYEREDGTLWVDNGEYASQVNFCPYCGYRAKVLAISTKDYETILEILKTLPTADDEIFRREYRNIEYQINFSIKEIEDIFNIKLTDYSHVIQPFFKEPIPIRWKHPLVAYGIEKIKEKQDTLKGI